MSLALLLPMLPVPTRTPLPSSRHHWPRCPLTGLPMTDPVIDRQGVSYERAAVVECYERTGRAPTVPGDATRCSLVPNLALKGVIAALREVLPHTGTDGADAGLLGGDARPAAVAVLEYMPQLSLQHQVQAALDVIAAHTTHAAVFHAGCQVLLRVLTDPGCCAAVRAVVLGRLCVVVDTMREHVHDARAQTAAIAVLAVLAPAINGDSLPSNAVAASCAGALLASMDAHVGDPTIHARALGALADLGPVACLSFAHRAVVSMQVHTHVAHAATVTAALHLLACASAYARPADVGVHRAAQWADVACRGMAAHPGDASIQWRAIRVLAALYSAKFGSRHGLPPGLVTVDQAAAVAAALAAHGQHCRAMCGDGVALLAAAAATERSAPALAEHLPLVLALADTGALPQTKCACLAFIGRLARDARTYPATMRCLPRVLAIGTAAQVHDAGYINAAVTFALMELARGAATAPARARLLTELRPMRACSSWPRLLMWLWARRVRGR
jgi:hypothetical protein